MALITYLAWNAEQSQHKALPPSVLIPQDMFERHSIAANSFPTPHPARSGFPTHIFPGDKSYSAISEKKEMAKKRSEWKLGWRQVGKWDKRHPVANVKLPFIISRKIFVHICPDYKMLKKSHLCIFTGCYSRTRNTNGDSSFPEHAPSLSQTLGLTGAVQDLIGWHYITTLLLSGALRLVGLLLPHGCHCG